MIQVYLTASLLLTLLFTALVGLIRAQPYDDAELRAFLTPPEGCPAPCFMEIKPGVTTLDEALAILEAHEWVDQVTVYIHEQTGPTTRVNWDWSGSQPGLIAVTADSNPLQGNLQISENIVTAITIPTAISLADFWLLWGAADDISFTTAMGANANDPVVLIYYGLHADYLAWTGTFTYCPYFPEFWKSKVSLEWVSNTENDRALFLGQSPTINPYAQLAASLRHRRC